MRSQKSRFNGLLVGLLALALFAAACGDDDDDVQASEDSEADGGTSSSTSEATSTETEEEAGGDLELTSIKVGITGLASNAPLYIAEQEGWFEEEGLDVEIEVMGGGALVVPALTNGELHIGSSNLISMMQAWNNDLRLPAVGVTNIAASSEDDEEYLSSAVLVRADSAVQTPSDLAGTTVAVNALNSLGDLTIKAMVENDGGDPNAVQFTEVQIPAMLAALGENRVEAVWTVEPFLSQGRAEGHRVVGYNFVGAMPGLPLGTYNVTEDFLSENPNTAAAFTRVMARAAEYANENPDAVREIVPTYTRIPPEAAQTMGLPVFAATLDQGNVEELAAMSEKYGLIDEVPDLEALFGNIYE